MTRKLNDNWKRGSLLLLGKNGEKKGCCLFKVIFTNQEMLMNTDITEKALFGAEWTVERDFKSATINFVLDLRCNKSNAELAKIRIMSTTNLKETMTMINNMYLMAATLAKDKS